MLIRGSSFLWVLLVHHPRAIAPALIHLHQRPLDARREVAQQNVAGRMYSQRRSDQKQKRRGAGEFAAGEVSVAREFAVLLMPADSRPVVEPLQRQVNVLVGLQLQDGEPAIEGAGEHVEHGAIGSRERWNLGVHEAAIEPLVDYANRARN